MDLKKFASKWPIGDIKQIKRYPAGQHNYTYKVNSSKGNYTLRIYDYKKPDQIKFELAILKKLKRMEVPQVVSVKRKQILKTDDKKYAIMYVYLPGKQLTSFTSKQLQEVGKFMAEYHNKVKNFTWKRYRYQYYNLPDSKIKKFTTVLRKSKLKYLNNLPSIVKDLKRSRLSSKLPKGPIHVDIKPENTLFHKGKLSGVIDFDNTYIGPFLLDLAKSMIWFGTKNKKFHFKIAKDIYLGYTQKRKLTSEEYKDLYKAIKFTYLSHIFVDYYMRAINVIGQKYFEFMAKDFYNAYEIFKITEKEFYQALK